MLGKEESSALLPQLHIEITMAIALKQIVLVFAGLLSTLVREHQQW